MEQELINSLYELNEAISDTPQYKNFIEREKELEANEEVCVLSYKKDMALLDYEDTLKHFKKGSDEEMKAFKKMKESIDALNNHKVVKAYNEALIQLNLLMEDIQKEIFEGIHD